MSILVVGDANADLSAAAQRFPGEGDDVQLRSIGWGSGGAGINVASALARLGARARLLARVGADPAAEVALRVAQAAGVDLALVQRDETVATGLCFVVISPGGERSFFSFRGANAHLELPHDHVFDEVQWLHICGHALLEGAQRATTLALAEAAARRRVPVSLDLCLPLLYQERQLVLKLLPGLDVLFANEPELALLFPGLTELTASDEAIGCGARIVALKRGATGCRIARGGEHVDVPGFAVDAIDCNGCGDAFVGGFLHMCLSGGTLAECGELANALGALTASRPGSADALPDKAQLRAFLAERLRTTGAFL